MVMKKRKEISYLKVFLRKNNISITLLSIIHFSANSPGQLQHRCLGSIYYLVISQLRVSLPLLISLVSQPSSLTL